MRIHDYTSATRQGLGIYWLLPTLARLQQPDQANPGVALMGDFWHTTREETSDMAAFIAAG